MKHENLQVLEAFARNDWKAMGMGKVQEVAQDALESLRALRAEVKRKDEALRNARRSVEYEIRHTVSNSHQMDARRVLVEVDAALRPLRKGKKS